VAGGFGGSSGSALASAELYNPATAAFTFTTSGMSSARAAHTATLLNTGAALMTGGYNSVALNSAELFGP
jgi:hypothetical protein